jgi:hypothetical protein
MTSPGPPSCQGALNTALSRTSLSQNHLFLGRRSRSSGRLVSVDRSHRVQVSAAAAAAAGKADQRLRRCFAKCLRAHSGQHACSLPDLRARLRDKKLPEKAGIAMLTEVSE